MLYTEYLPTVETESKWQPPKSLQIIPYERIETCPISYTPESARKPIKIKGNKET